jgi:hypothetical protein
MYVPTQKKVEIFQQISTLFCIHTYLGNERGVVDHSKFVTMNSITFVHCLCADCLLGCITKKIRGTCLLHMVELHAKISMVCTG